MSRPVQRMNHPTLWVSFCGRFRVIHNNEATGFLVQSFSGNIWNTFSEHHDWLSIKRKYADTYTFSDIPDEPPFKHRSFTYYEDGAFPVDGYNSLTFSIGYPV